MTCCLKFINSKMDWKHMDLVFHLCVLNGHYDNCNVSFLNKKYLLNKKSQSGDAPHTGWTLILYYLCWLTIQHFATLVAQGDGIYWLCLTEIQIYFLSLIAWCLFNTVNFVFNIWYQWNACLTACSFVSVEIYFYTSNFS